MLSCRRGGAIEAIDGAGLEGFGEPGLVEGEACTGCAAAPGAGLCLPLMLLARRRRTRP